MEIQISVFSCKVERCLCWARIPPGTEEMELGTPICHIPIITLTLPPPPPLPFIVFFFRIFIIFMYRKLNSAYLTQLGGQFLKPWSFPAWQRELPTLDPGRCLSSEGGSHFVVIGPDNVHQLSQNSFVFQVNLCEGNCGAGLPVD